MPDHETFQVTQKLVLFNQESKKFLLVKDSQPDTYFHQHYGPWELVGGRVHVDEELEESFEREVSEEAEDLEYEIIGAIHAVRTRTEKSPVACIAYLGLYKKGEIKLSDEHTEFRWESAENIAKGSDYKPWLKEIILAAEVRLKEKEYLNDLKRIQADFDNYKKRQGAEKDEFSRYMINTIVTELVPVLDNFNMAISHVPQDKKNDPWVTGMTYIEKQFEEVLGKYGVKVLEAKAGDPFDPTRHEAIEHKEKDGAQSKDLIIEKVLQNGYIMGDKVVKAAKVNVTNI